MSRKSGWQPEGIRKGGRIWGMGIGFAIVVGLVGCGAEDAGELEDDRQWDFNVDDADGGESSGSLTGTWAKKVVISALTDSLLGEEQTSTTSILRVEVMQDGEVVQVRSEPCAITIDSGGFATTTIPQAFVDSLEVSERTGTFREGRLILDWAVEVRGVEFGADEDRESTPLPTEADDPRVIDQDGDGHPGMTVEVDAGIVKGDVYVVQRGRDRFEGRAFTETRIEGLVEWEDEQEVLGASSQALMLGQPESRPNPDSDASYFIMESLGDDAGCAEVVAAF